MSTMDDFMNMPHSVNSYLIIKDYLDETNDLMAYIYLIQNYIHDVPGVEIFRLMDRAHKTLDEDSLETMVVTLFENI